MIKVFENFELAIVGQVQSLLEAHGIETYLKNQYASGALGELPFVEICPQLYVLRERDVADANRLIRSLSLDNGETTGEAWVCAECGAEVDAGFDTCWKCSRPRG